MQSSPGGKDDPHNRTGLPPDEFPAPRLLVELAPGYRVFLNNLLDLVLPFRQPPQAWILSKPAPFWDDVFVKQGLPWRSLRLSGMYHVFVVVALWGISITWLGYRPRVFPRNPFENSTLTYYSVSEYLPPLDTGSPPAKEEKKGEPAFAKQRIISLPPAPDNFRQTIITPDKIRLPQDVPLPNLVAWTPVPAPSPQAAAEALSSRLTLPRALASVVPPPPDARAANSRIPALPAPQVVQPAPSARGVESDRRLGNGPQPAVVGPPVSADALRRNLGDMNMAAVDMPVEEPKLPVPIQLAPSVGLPGSGGGGNGAGAAMPAPPAVVGGGNGSGQAAMGQIIALGLNPTAPSGPIEVPKGSRYGQFAATPEGKPGAPGTPDIKGGGTTAGGGGNGSGTSGSGNGGDGNGPPGISISPGPTAPGTGPVVAGNGGNGGNGGSPSPRESAPKPVMTASLPTRPADVVRKQPASSVTEPAKIEDKVFAGKRYYSMTLNMPNLTSAGGSWIIRFAELNENSNKGTLTAPVATLKVDPAYPAEALRDQIEGTVTLYAVIHKDGSVGDVRVLNGVDQRLDQNACQALLHWHFRPGTVNGDAVDLEAVVQIPFRARKLPF